MEMPDMLQMAPCRLTHVYPEQTTFEPWHRDGGRRSVPISDAHYRLRLNRREPSGTKCDEDLSLVISEFKRPAHRRAQVRSVRTPS